MTKYFIADFRMKKEYLQYIEDLGYEYIKSDFNLDLYDEISAHVDVSYVQVVSSIVVSPDKFISLSKKMDCIMGQTHLENNYPNDVAYNVCIMGKKAIHNFKYTDPKLKDLLIANGYELINVNQGYTNCSIAVIDENSCITSDIGIAKVLMDKGIDVLFAHEPDIKLLRRINTEETYQENMKFEYSDMQGFIGGAMATIGDEVIVFGDINKFLNSEKIIQFIESKGKKIKSFEGQDIIDYGGIVIKE